MAKVRNTQEIDVVEPVDAARLRPAMYLGAVGPDGVRAMIAELVGCLIDEFSAGEAMRITLAVWSDGRVMVRDDGRGLPTHIIDPQTQRPLVEWIATDPTCPYERDPAARRQGSIHACSGYFLVNAFSTSLIIENRTGGQAWQTEFARGKLTVPRHPTEPTDESGLCLTFRLDPEILKTTELDTDWLLEWFREQSCLYPGLTFELIDERCDVHREFCSQRGIEDLLRHTIAARPEVDRETLYDEPITFEIVHGSVSDEDAIRLHVTLQHTVAPSGEIAAYVNGIRLPDGGTHVTGMQRGLRDAIVRYALTHPDLFASDRTVHPMWIDADRITARLTAVVSLRMRDPMFEGPTKNQLGNQLIVSLVRRRTREILLHHFERDPQCAAAIVRQALASML